MSHLVTFKPESYRQKHAAPIIQQMKDQTTKNCYQQSPYMTLNRRKLKVISNDMRKSLKLQEILDQNCDNNNHLSVNEDEKELLIPNEDLIEIELGSNVNNNYSPNESIQEEDVPLPEKLHEFKITNFKGFFWCELCANFLWGFTAQGVKCDHCGKFLKKIYG